MKERERRHVEMIVEARQADGGPPTLAGYAARFNKETVVAGLFREIIAPGAFGAALARSDVRALWNHDSTQLPLGRTSAGTLELAEDAKGLRYTITLPETSFARDLYAVVKRGDVRESSFAFIVGDEEWLYPKDGIPVRTIRTVDELFDVSPVVYPAYESTTVAARTAEAALATVRAEEQRAQRRAAELVLERARLRWAKAAADGA